MKKFTLSLFSLLFTAALIGQTYSTGTVNLTTGYSAKIDVTSSLVTVTLIGPSTGWLGLSFNSTSMDDIGNDVIIFNGTVMTDRTFDGQGVVPPLDAIQNWSVTTNAVAGSVRTVVATRARDTGDPNDYAFSASAQSLNLVWARKLADFSINYHGSGSCGATVVNFTLGNDDFKINDFKIFPNPAKGFTTIELPTNIETGVVKIYDTLGRLVKNQSISLTENTIKTAELTTGTYMVVLRTDYGNATKSLQIE